LKLAHTQYHAKCRLERQVTAKASTNDAVVPWEREEEFQKTKQHLHIKTLELTKLAPDTVTKSPPEMSPDEGTILDSTALKLKGVIGTIAG